MGSGADVGPGIGSGSCPLGVDVASGTDLASGKSGGAGAQAPVGELNGNGAALNTAFTGNGGWGWTNGGSRNGSAARTPFSSTSGAFKLAGGGFGPSFP